MTLKDIEGMSVEEMMNKDKRSFMQYFIDCLYTDHIVMRAFFLKSILNPQFIRILNLFTLVTIVFSITAMFQSDGNTDFGSSDVI